MLTIRAWKGIAWLVICLCVVSSKELNAQDMTKGQDQRTTIPNPPTEPTPLPIAIAELDGTTLTGVIHYANRVRRDGKTYSGTADWKYRIEIRAKGVLHVLVMWQAQFPGKTPPLQRYSNVETVGVPTTKRDQDGARSVLWSFENDTLTQLRVYDAGGRRIDFKMGRVAGGFSCDVKSAFLTEDNKLVPKIAGWDVLERRELRSNCKATRAKG